jgi:IS5 family transposase
VLPEVCLRLPVELERVDAWLDDEAFFAPFRAHFDPLTGRPSLPMEAYLRMMDLNVRYRLGHETLVPGGVRLDLVAAVLPHRHRLRVPHPTTLMKITTRCGEDTALALNEAAPPIIPRLE